MRLTGSLAQKYSITYAVYVEGKGWTAYSKDNAMAGTTGQSRKITALSVYLQKKKLPKAPSDETKRSAVALVNLYEDAAHQKTVTDLETFAGVAPTAAITSKQVMDWYHYLGLVFDTQNGRFSKAKSMAVNKSGRLYYTFLKAKTAPDNIQNWGMIGMGYKDESFSYSPEQSYLNEDFSPSMYWAQRGKETFSQTNDRMKTYDYDHIYTKDEQGKQASEYEEEVTLYNIRAKESTDTVDVNTPIDSPSSPATSVNAINAAYHPLAHFIPSGTQGQEPWCSEYVAASAINNINQITASTPQENRVTAQAVMQAYQPNVSLEQLKTMGGGSIDNSLKALQSKYQVTADVENRTLNFNEVKKELDAGQMIQMDAYDQNETAPQGSAENTGHSLAIVGYIMPADGDTTKHAPYYEVWNPWWGNTFYVSSKAPYFNLAGTQYKWTRTWHNWRKVTAGATTKTAPVIAQQKVASATNPNVMDVPKEKELQNINKSFGEQRVSNYGAPISYTDVFYSGTSFWYSYRNDNAMIAIGVNNAMTKGLNRSNNTFGSYVSLWKQVTDEGLVLSKQGFLGISLSYLSAIFAVASLGASTATLKAVRGMLALVGIKVSDIGSVADTIVSYKQDVNNLQKTFVKALSDSDRIP